MVFFSLNVLGNFYFNFRVTGEPTRLLPELDMIYIMVIVLLPALDVEPPAGRVARRGGRHRAAPRSGPPQDYLRRAWDIVPSWPDYTNRVEYRVTDWLWKNMPDARAYPTGSVRFWYDTWHDLAQVGGGSEQGLLNGQVEPAQWETNLGPDPEPTILWMQSMGVDAIYVADKQSQEIFKDFQYPAQVRRRAAGALRRQAGQHALQRAAPLARPHPRGGDRQAERRQAAALQRRRGVPAGLRRCHREGSRFARAR